MARLPNLAAGGDAKAPANKPATVVPAPANSPTHLPANAPAHVPAVGAGDAASVQPATGAAPPATPALPSVLSLGEGEQKIHLVDHGDSWSMHAENTQTAAIFRLWHEAGGPEMISKVLLDFPFTLSVHQVPTERIVERILEGYGFTLHYDAAGRLERVRVYSPQPQRMFKTPRLVESLGAWRQVESGGVPAEPPAPPASQPQSLDDDVVPDADAEPQDPQQIP